MCTNCNMKEPEDEFHFLMRCTKYEDLRVSFFQNIAAEFSYFNLMDEERKFNWLCSNNSMYIIKHLGHMIAQCFQKRT